MTRAALAIYVVLCAMAMARGFALRELDGAARAILLAGVIWLLGLWRRVHWFSTAALISAVLGAAVGLFLDVPGSWMLAGTIFALMAWDLTDFRLRLETAAAQDDVKGIEQRHLLRLHVLTLGGLLLASIGMLVRWKIPFEWMLLLVVVTALGLTQFLRWLRDSR